MYCFVMAAVLAHCFRYMPLDYSQPLVSLQQLSNQVVVVWTKITMSIMNG